MCLILHKQAGHGLPKDYEKIVRSEFLGNPHGGGVMWMDQACRTVMFKKGLMTVDKVLEEVFRIEDEMRGLKNLHLAVHLRFATHGTKGPEMTHPFAVSERKGDIRSLAMQTQAALMHNGVIYGMAGKDLSDSARLAIAIAKIGLRSMSDDHVAALIGTAIGSSRVLIYASGWEPIFFGAWHKYHGLMTSNDLNPRAVTTYGSGYGLYDDAPYRYDKKDVQTIIDPSGGKYVKRGRHVIYVDVDGTEWEVDEEDPDYQGWLEDMGLADPEADRYDPEDDPEDRNMP